MQRNGTALWNSSKQRWVIATTLSRSFRSARSLSRNWHISRWLYLAALCSRVCPCCEKNNVKEYQQINRNYTPVLLRQQLSVSVQCFFQGLQFTAFHRTVSRMGIK